MNTRRWLVVLYIFSCFSFSCSITTSGVQVDCEPDPSKAHGASCLPVKDGEASCNGDIAFRYKNKLTECFGKYINRFLDIGAEKCRSSPNITAQPVDPPKMPFTCSFIPYNFRYYNLAITMDFTSNVDAETYVLFLEYQKQKYYFCINVNETELNLTLQYQNQDDSIVLGSLLFQDTFQSPRHCADYQHIHYDVNTCGLPQLEKPRNIVLWCNETHTRISWEPACYMKPGTTECIVPDQDTYYLTLSTCDNKTHYFTIRNTTSVTVNMSTILGFTLYAYSPCSGLYQERINVLENVIGCSKPANSHDSSDSSSCVVPPLTGCSTPTPTPSPDMGTDPTSPSSHDDYLAVYIAAGMGGLIILITVLVIAVIILYKKKGVVHTPGYLPVRQDSPSPSDYSALVVYSSSTPELEKRTIMQKLGPYVQNLENGIGSYLQDTRKPQQNLIDWITEHHKKANAVFCVCNEEFIRNWENSFSSDSDVAVRTLRQLFEGELQRGPEAVKKYAVVLPTPADRVFVPAILKKQCQLDMSDTDNLAKFVRHELHPVSTAQV